MADFSAFSSNNAQVGGGKPNFKATPPQASNIKKIIAVASGKGGVGKSSVTALAAIAMQRLGYKCAILDADITGPSIPKIFGLDGNTLSNEYGMVPAVSDSGIKIISINLIMEDKTTPAVWRGPIIASVVKQFYSEVHWGEIDYMFVDMPPGTGDVPLTVFQSLPMNGSIMVTSPQQLVSLVVEKAMNMMRLMNVPILGLVENMSSFVCDECGKRHDIYGSIGGEALAQKFMIPYFTKLPLDKNLALLCDAGQVEMYDSEYLDEISRIIIKM